MSTSLPRRKLTAILCADAVGFSRLMEKGEEEALRTLAGHRAALEALISENRGRVVDTAGDGVLAEFPSAVDAVRCALAVQQQLATLNEPLPEGAHLEYRIGVNAGDVIEEDGRLYGDGVNVASRVEGLAAAGEVWVTESVRHHVAGKLDVRFEDRGVRELKNLAKPAQVYRLGTGSAEAVASPRGSGRWKRSTAAVVALSAFIGWAVWRFTPLAMEEAPLPAAAVPSETISIAVLPFENLTGDPEQGSFADGLADDLITDLAKIANLHVIARNSAFTYQGRAAKVQEIAQDLGVRYLLEGSVRKEGGKHRINAQLIDAETGGHLWAERFEVEEGDMLAAQDAINHEIVAALSLRLTDEEWRRLDQPDTGSLDAHLEFRKGWEHFLRRTDEDFGAALAHYERALELDPEYGEARAALALLYWRASAFAMCKSMNVSYTSARLLAVRHLELARRRPTARMHATAADIHLYARRYDEAISEMALAVALEPGNAYYNAYMARVLALVGPEPAEARQFAEKAVLLDPSQPSYYHGALAASHLRLGRAEEALAAVDEVIAENPRRRSILVLRTIALGLLGREAEARASLDEYLTTWTRDPHLQAVSYFLTYRDPPFMERAAGVLVRAGLEDTGYLDSTDVDRVRGQDLAQMVNGRALVGVHRGESWRMEASPDGSAQWIGQAPASDTGLVWIEDDLLCEQWAQRWEGLKHCRTVFRYPRGSAKTLDQYVSYTPVRYYTFSVVEL